MTGALFEISAPELTASAAILERVAERAGALAPALDEIGGMLTTSVQHRFETGTGPDGEAWTPSGRAKADAGQTLLDRGHLRDSVHHAVEGLTVRVGTNLKYGAIHQFGGVIEAKNAEFLIFRRRGGGFVKVKLVTIPARPFLGMDAADIAEASAILEERITSPLDTAR